MLESTATLGLPRRLDDARSASARSSPASPTATRRTSPRSSPPSTCCPGGRAFCGLGAAWFRPRARAVRVAVPAARRALRAARGRPRAAAADVGQGHAAVRGPAHHACRPRRATRGRCRSTCRSSSAGPASGARCASSPATPTPATCSATRPTVARKVDVLRRHCEAEGRDPATVTITNLSEAAVLGGSAERGRALRAPSSARSRSTSAATASGPRPASRRPIVALHLDGTPAQIEAFAPVIAAFR